MGLVRSPRPTWRSAARAARRRRIAFSRAGRNAIPDPVADFLADCGADAGHVRTGHRSRNAVGEVGPRRESKYPAGCYGRALHREWPAGDVGASADGRRNFGTARRGREAYRGVAGRAAAHPCDGYEHTRRASW